MKTVRALSRISPTNDDLCLPQMTRELVSLIREQSFLGVDVS